ncbi:hypothetical protein Pelo_16949 [Pelomyxa schiedti]|nr:hypothetical protein Pelo_16949 [Pelomyxa schiedti]
MPDPPALQVEQLTNDEHAITRRTNPSCGPATRNSSSSLPEKPIVMTLYPLLNRNRICIVKCFCASGLIHSVEITTTTNTYRGGGPGGSLRFNLELLSPTEYITEVRGVILNTLALLEFVTNRKRVVTTARDGRSFIGYTFEYIAPPGCMLGHLYITKTEVRHDHKTIPCLYFVAPLWVRV